jgi:MFS transporter, DHA1 family, inner membrane transport protein
MNCMPVNGRALPTPDRRVTWMLWALTLGSFLTTSSGAIRSPFLLDMAHDLDTDLLAIANLMAANSVTWGLASLVAGTASDRFGRKAILTAAIVLVGASMGGIGLTDSYLGAVFWVLAGGIGGGSFMGTVFATVSDHVQPTRRGAALGWVMTGQSVSLALGVPLATLIAAQAGWRGAHFAFFALTVLVGLAMLFLVPRRGVFQPTAREAAAAAPLQTILTPRILSLLSAGATERVCFAAMTVYLATFLIATYDVPLEILAVALLLITLGNLVGNMLGGQIADRVRSRDLLYGFSLAATGLLALPLLLWTPGLGISVALGFAYTLANAIGRPSFMAALSAVPEAVRGTVLGLNVTFASVGWIAAAAFGGWLVASSGFGSLGIFCATSALVGTILLGIGGLLEGRRLAAGPTDESAPAPAGG